MCKRRYLCIWLLICCVLFVSGCVKRTSGSGGTAGLQKEHKNTEETETGDADSMEKKKNTVIVSNIDTQAAQLTVKSLSDNTVFVLNYSSGTSIQNRYGTEVLIDSILPGEIMDVEYMAGSQRLISMKKSDEAWENTTVTKWNIDYDRNIMQIGSDTYSFDENLVVVSEGRVIDVHKLHTVDALIVKGIGTKVCSINVKNGHGYIKVTGQEDLIGGLIEVGTKIMTVITEDMIIVAPEGEYKLTATKDNIGGTKEITVTRDSETFVSLSEFRAEVEREGSVKFNIQPSDVDYNVFVDGKAVDVTEAVPLSYGTHKLVITSSRYADYQEELVVSSIYMNKTIDLSAVTQDETSDEETASSGETTKQAETSSEGATSASGNEQTTDLREDGVESMTGETSNNYLVVSGPVGAEVYMDGVKKGTAPITFAKSAGEHIFVLRQEGYVTTAYTYVFDSSSKDIFIKFPDMEKEKQ